MHHEEEEEDGDSSVFTPRAMPVVESVKQQAKDTVSMTGSIRYVFDVMLYIGLSES